MGELKTKGTKIKATSLLKRSWSLVRNGLISLTPNNLDFYFDAIVQSCGVSVIWVKL